MTMGRGIPRSHNNPPRILQPSEFRLRAAQQRDIAFLSVKLCKELSATRVTDIVFLGRNFHGVPRVALPTL